MPHQIVKMDNGRPSTNGKLVQFEMHTKAGEVLTIEMPTKNIGNFVAFLCGLAQFATRESAAITEQSDSYEGALIEASHISLAQGRIDDEVIFAIQLGEFALGIALPKQGTGPLKQAVSQILPSTKKAN